MRTLRFQRLWGSPRLGDAMLAATAAAALILNGVLSGGLDDGIVPMTALALVTCAPLAWRRSAPVAVLLAVGGGLVVCIAAFEPYYAAIAVAMVALYTVAVLGDRRRSLAVGAATAIVLVAILALLDATGNLREGTDRLLLVLGALVVGDTVRSRRALRAAAAERIEREAREGEAESRRRASEERLGIARDLHDTIAHALVAINVRAGVSARLETSATSLAALNQIKDVSAEALHDLRGTLDLLRDPAEAAPVRPEQDLAALAELIQGARAGGLDAVADVRLGGAAIASALSQAGFRIVQESLTNVLRHAQATRASVTVRIRADILDIEVTDDGRGGWGEGEGHGLRGMAERAGALGGRVVAGPAAAGGWRVHAQLPTTRADGT